MMKRDFIFASTDGVTKIHGIEWKPEGDMKAILQISHGMVEYIDRYDAFASFLTEHGYYVVGHDHLGHGQSVQTEEDHGFFAHPNGNECVIGDIHRLRGMVQKKYPDTPYFMLGHSMGSFLIRQYMEMHGKGLDGVIVMGTGSQPGAVLAVGKTICKTLAAFKGWRHRSDFVDNMAFASYNKKFEPARTDKDWLTKDEAIVDAYRAHPWCTFQFTVNAYYHMFCGIQYAQTHVDQIPKDLPLFVVAGADDPVGNFGKSVAEVSEGYKKAGIKDVTLKLYENDRHEILNETDRQVVYEDIWRWVDAHLQESC